jgi:hypothetical protein
MARAAFVAILALSAFAVAFAADDGERLWCVFCDALAAVCAAVVRLCRPVLS